MKRLILLFLSSIILVSFSACHSSLSADELNPSEILSKTDGESDAQAKGDDDLKRFENVKVGDVIRFGSFDRDGKPETEKENISWLGAFFASVSTRPSSLIRLLVSTLLR